MLTAYVGKPRERRPLIAANTMFLWRPVRRWPAPRPIQRNRRRIELAETLQSGQFCLSNGRRLCVVG